MRKHRTIPVKQAEEFLDSLPILKNGEEIMVAARMIIQAGNAGGFGDLRNDKIEETVALLTTAFSESDPSIVLQQMMMSIVEHVVDLQCSTT